MRRVGVVALLAAALVLSALLVGCGGDDGPQLSQQRRQDLLDRVAAVRATLGAYAPDQARAHLAVLREQVTDLERRNRISDDQASSILSAAAAVEADLGLAPTTTTTTTTLPLDLRGKGHGKEKGKDEG
jgi:hypothetical protein